MKRFFDPCRRQRKEISLWVAGVLTETEVAAVQQHLVTCEGCRRFHVEMKSVSAPLIKWEKNFSDVKADSQFEARWTKAVHAAKKTGTAPEKARETIPVSWQDLLLSFRWHLTGLSALWLLIGLLNMEPSVSRGPVMAQHNKPSTEQVVASLRENRRRMQELMEQAGASAPALVVPQTSLPRRRSEIETPTEMV
ncbi:MAG: hypothetical protein JWM68_266 [Verrucomicrobiales bacterium]|nr:hypothetical protein [Verrucomicrobiales bacterium]